MRWLALMALCVPLTWAADGTDERAEAVARVVATRSGAIPGDPAAGMGLLLAERRPRWTARPPDELGRRC